MKRWTSTRLTISHLREAGGRGWTDEELPTPAAGGSKRGGRGGPNSTPNMLSASKQSFIGEMGPQARSRS